MSKSKKNREIEVTPEMIEAGLSELYESGFYERCTSADPIVMEKVLGAALSKAYP